MADVVGHGISSALIMARVRSALRQRLAMPGSISQIITDEIMETIFSQIKKFLKTSKPEDDLTLVVVKVL